MTRVVKKPKRVGPPVFGNSKEYIFRSYADAASDIREWSRRLPSNIVAVSGVPRAGVMIGTMLAHRLNVHYVDFQDLTNNVRQWETTPLRRHVPTKKEGIVLVMEDTCCRGVTIEQYRDLIHPELKEQCKFASLYVAERGKQYVDYWGRTLSTRFHFFEWNMLRDHLTRWAHFDFDGVLCEDWRGGDEEKSPALYEDHLKNAKPLWLPAWHIRRIVTARLEKYRPQTVAWLRRHGVKYLHLDMAPFTTVRERQINRGFGERKAVVYRNDRGARLFIDNCHNQAVMIHRLARKPVFSLEKLQLLGGVDPDPFPA